MVPNKISAVLIILLLLSDSRSAFGQLKGQAPPSQQPSARPAVQPTPVKTRAQEFATKELDQAPADLPNLPVYTGNKKFRRGFWMPNTYGGPTYVMVFDTGEDASTVLSWYSQSLQNTGWKIGKSDDKNINAANKTNRCQINVSQFIRPNKAGMRAQLIVNYRVTGQR